MILIQQFKHSHFIPYGCILSLYPLCYYSVLFLRPFSSCCPPLSSSFMMTKPIMLSKRPSLEAPVSFTLLLSLLLFDILTLIRGLGIFMLYYHQYFYRDTIYRMANQGWRVLHLPMTHGYTPLDANPVFDNHVVIIVIIIIIIINIYLIKAK